MENIYEINADPVEIKEEAPPAQEVFTDKPLLTKLLAEKSNCKVLFLSFANGHELKPHTSPVDVILAGLGGKAELLVNDTPVLVECGVVVTILAYITHSLKAVSDFKMLLIE